MQNKGYCGNDLATMTSTYYAKLAITLAILTIIARETAIRAIFGMIENQFINSLNIPHPKKYNSFNAMELIYRIT